MKNFLDKIFLLPPAHERRMIKGPLQQALFPNFISEKNDHYVYYLCFKYSFVIGLFLSLINWLFYEFGLSVEIGSFSVKFSQTGFNKEFLYSYPFYMAAISWTLILPFYYWLFKKNVDPKSFISYSWVDKKKLLDDPDPSSKNLQIATLSFVMPPFVGVALYWLCNRLFLTESYGFFIFSLFSAPFGIALFNYTFLASFTAEGKVPELIKKKI